MQLSPNKQANCPDKDSKDNKIVISIPTKVAALNFACAQPRRMLLWHQEYWFIIQHKKAKLMKFISFTKVLYLVRLI